MPASPENRMTRPSPASCLCPAPKQEFGFLLAIDERRLGGTQRLEAALEPVLPQHPPSALRLGKAFQVLEPKIIQRENRSRPTRVLSAITIVFGSASASSRAARFGTSPRTSFSLEVSDPIRSPTTTRPVAMPKPHLKRLPVS